MTLANIISMISAIDEISIQDENGVVFNGKCQDFRATFDDANKILEHKVERIRSYNSVTIILL